MLISVLATDTSPTRCNVVKADESCQRECEQIFSSEMFDEVRRLRTISFARTLGRICDGVTSSSVSSPHQPGSIKESLPPRVKSPKEIGLVGLNSPRRSLQTSSMLASSPHEWSAEIMSWAMSNVSSVARDKLDDESDAFWSPLGGILPFVLLLEVLLRELLLFSVKKQNTY